MRNKHVCLFGIFLSILLLCVCSTRSPFSGVWIGKMIQPEGPRELIGYNQFLKISVQGSSFEGIAHIEIPDTVFFAQMKVTGTIKNDSLFFEETSFLNQQARNGYHWCLKKGILILDRQQMTLSGNWHSSNCVPGMIELRRIFE